MPLCYYDISTSQTLPATALLTNVWFTAINFCWLKWLFRVGHTRAQMMFSSSVTDHHASGFRVPSGVPAEPLPVRLICNHSWLTYTNCSAWCSFLALDSNRRPHSPCPCSKQTARGKVTRSCEHPQLRRKRDIKHSRAFRVQKGDLGFQSGWLLFYLFAFSKLWLLHRRHIGFSADLFISSVIRSPEVKPLMFHLEVFICG